MSVSVSVSVSVAVSVSVSVSVSGVVWCFVVVWSGVSRSCEGQQQQASGWRQASKPIVPRVSVTP
eukprot:8659599-Alexandrium_andersonii.AAC.1